MVHLHPALLEEQCKNIKVKKGQKSTVFWHIIENILLILRDKIYNIYLYYRTIAATLYSSMVCILDCFLPEIVLLDHVTKTVKRKNAILMAS